ncbi:response regulator [Saccharospirillum salsuginis]|uniref:DNA-binding response regulator n=1 Tax=Saccharospirillum salsuginis TaxID=418750 RepID=A0A918K022_9GAMM|nr:response regulator transcription factor [Saccharospirillum salsuginis]GGX40929.1 DNA-binding response regulator [Saccharospirillum salsuginis]
METILVVEDHEQMQAWLREVAEMAFHDAEVVTASTLGQARKHLETRRFSLALVDIGLPDGNGIDLIRELATQTEPECYPVVTTIYDDDQHLFSALEAGAKGYLLKDQPRERLCDQLKGISRGEPPLSPSVARRILRYFQPSTGSSLEENAQNENHLTNRETEVLRLLARGLKRNEIAERLGITANTVAGYVKTIYRKLNISGRSEATLQAVKMGLIDRDD